MAFCRCTSLPFLQSQLTKLENGMPVDYPETTSKLGVSERWVRDHTTRRSPKIRAVKLGPLVRYRWADVEVFMEGLDTLRPSRQAPFGV
jgi:hypothetical protein